MGANFRFLITLILFILPTLIGCSRPVDEPIIKIALLAPFEGRYREVGYHALYAARLAIADSQQPQIELLAIDDGGSIDNAVKRAQAISYDPAINAAIVLGELTSDEVVLTNITEIPVFIVGNWGTITLADNRFWLTNPHITDDVTNIPLSQLNDLEQPLRLSDAFALTQLPELVEEIDLIEIISSSSLPDTDFREHYINSDLFVPEPGLLATLTYDATRFIIDAITHDGLPARISYEGVNGIIEFDQSGYWIDAPINTFRYIDGILTANN